MALDFKNIKINEPQADMPTPQTDGQNQSQSLEKSSTVSTTEPATHFDSLLSTPEAMAQEASAALPDGQIMTKEQFHLLFCGAFNISSKLSQLKSLEVNESDGATVACSESLYDICLEIPVLHFILSPQGKWGTRIISIGAFAVPMALAVTAEVKQRQATANPISAPNGQSQVNSAEINF